MSSFSNDVCSFCKKSAADIYPWKSVFNGDMKKLNKIFIQNMPWCKTNLQVGLLSLSVEIGGYYITRVLITIDLPQSRVRYGKENLK